MEPSLVARAIEHRVRTAHRVCRVLDDGECRLGDLWAADIQEILDHAEDLKIK